MSIDFGKSVLSQEAQAILSLSENLDSSFSTAVEWILNCTGRVVACGLGKSGHIARKASGTFSSTGTPSVFLHAAEAIHGDLGMVTEADVVLLFTHSGETEEIVRLFPSFKAIGAKTILIAGRENSSAAWLSDLVLCTHVGEEACPNNLAPTTSTTVMLALSDALALTVMDRRKFGREDYAKLHPGGTLGKRLLLTVRDVMRTGDDVAYSGPDSAVLEVLQAITKAGAGAACIVDSDNQLLGFISDGDLRRHFMKASDPKTARAEEVMSHKVWVIESYLLATEALEFFQNLPKLVGEIPVVEDGKVVGLLMLKDLIRSGIA